MYARSGWNGPGHNPGDSPETGGGPFYGKDHKPDPWRARWNRRRVSPVSSLSGRLLGVVALACVLFVAAFLRSGGPQQEQGKQEPSSSWKQQQQQREHRPATVLPPPPPRRPPTTAATTTTKVQPSPPASSSSSSSSSSFAADLRARAPRQALVLDDRSVRCRVGKVCEGWRACPSKHLAGHGGAENGAAAAAADSKDPLGCVTSAPERAALVRAAIKDSWDAYAASAFGADELAPLSKTPAPPWFDLGLTLVDAMDTLLLAGLRDEYLAARTWVGAGDADGTQKGGRQGSGGGAGNLPSSDSKSAAKPGSREAGGLALDPDKEVNLFETTIRVLGGLLAAAHLESRWLPQRLQRRRGGSGGGGGSGSGSDGKSGGENATAVGGGGMALPLLSAAAQLGIRLSPALDGVGGIEIAGGESRRRRRRRGSRKKTKKEKKTAAIKDDDSSKPARRVPLSDVSLRRLEAAGPAWTSFSSLSEATTLSMEFSYLSRATGGGGGGGARNEGGDETEEDNDGLLKAASAAALSAARSVAASAASTIDPPSLPPIYVDPDSGTFHSGVVTLGARGDSYYEYLLKQWILGGKKGEKGRNPASFSSSTGDDVSQTQQADDDFDDDDDDDGIWMREAYVASMRSLRARLVARAPLPSTSEEGETKRSGGGGGAGGDTAAAALLETVPSLQRRRGGLAYVRELINGADSPKMDHLVCFLPGLLALGAAHGVDTRRRVAVEESSSSSLSSTTTTTTAASKANSSSSSSSFHPDDDEDVALAAQLALTCAEMYRAVPAGLAPEIVHFRERKEGEEGKGKEVIPGVGVAAAAAAAAATAEKKTTSEENVPEVGHGAFDVKPADAHNLLRPESVESWFLLWRLTGDEAYREWGWAAFRAWSKFSRVRPAANGTQTRDSSLGFANLDSVLEVPPRQRDKMESFWVAETLKYLYLMFDDEAAARLPLDQYVFNTEAHPLPIRGSAADEAASRGYLSLPLSSPLSPPFDDDGGGDSYDTSGGGDPAAASDAAEAARAFAERSFLRSRAAEWAAAGAAAVAEEEGARARRAAAGARGR